MEEEKEEEKEEEEEEKEEEKKKTRLNVHDVHFSTLPNEAQPVASAAHTN